MVGLCIWAIWWMVELSVVFGSWVWPYRMVKSRLFEVGGVATTVVCSGVSMNSFILGDSGVMRCWRRSLVSVKFSLVNFIIWAVVDRLVDRL